MNAFTIVYLQELCSDLDNIEITQHTIIRFQERGIQLNDVLSAINNGEIIEDYPDDYPFPSCLILGPSSMRHSLHVVCGSGNKKLWVITAYFPSTDKWESDFKTRKAAE